MYIYANADGQIKEIVNDVYLRQSNDKINHIYLYIDSFSEAIYNNISVTYKLPDDSVVGPQVVSLTSKVKQTIPYDKKRDLRYFKDYQEYEFYDIEIPTVDHEHTLGLGNVLSQTGLVKCTISFIKTSGSFALQILPFYVEESVVRYAYNINSDEYNYLLQIVLAPQSDKYVTLKSEEKQQFSDGLKYFVNEDETSQIILHLTQGSHAGSCITMKEGTLATSYNFNEIVTGETGNLHTLSFPSASGTLATTDFVSANPGGTFTNTLTSIRINGVDYGVSGGISGIAWGDITGTLSNQSDLKNALDAKQDKVELSIVDGELCITYEE